MLASPGFVSVFNDMLETDVIRMTSSSNSSTRLGERTGLVVRASDSGSGDPGSILGQVGVLFP